MSNVFDPYLQWLNIPPADQPPNHYRLLGLPAFEEDIEVIRAAAEERMGFLRTFQLSQQAAQAEALMNQIAEVLVCFSDPKKKTIYDVQLRKRLRKREEVTPRKEPARSTAWWRGLGIAGRRAIVASAVAAVLLLIGLLLLLTRGNDGSGQPSASTSPPSPPEASSPPDAQPAPAVLPALPPAFGSPGASAGQTGTSLPAKPDSGPPGSATAGDKSGLKMAVPGLAPAAPARSGAKAPLRQTPEILNVEKLKAAAGAGAFAMLNLVPNSIQASGPNRGQRWVVVTGLLPFGKQQELYGAALKGPQGPSPTLVGPATTAPELPIWVYYYVERAEATGDDQNVDSLEWTALNAALAWTSAMRRWRGGSSEHVPSKFLHPSVGFPMAFPLGPLVGANWGTEVAHEPEIPITAEDHTGSYTGAMMGPGMGGMAMGTGGLAPGTRKRTDKRKKPPEKSPALKAQKEAMNTAMEDYLKAESEVADGPPSLGTGVPGMTPGMGMMPGAGMMMPGAAAGMPGMPDGVTPEMMMPGVGAPMATGEVVPYQLFRFFDFTVEQGKRYRYRVRLELKNPNYQVDAQYLADKKQARIETLKSEWSPPTDAVSVPRDVRILAGQVTMPRDPLLEPSATFAVVRFDMETGETHFKAFPNEDLPLPKMSRGQLANFRGLPKPALKKPTSTGYGGAEPADMAMMGAMPGMPMMPAGAPGRKPETDTMDLLSDYALLDMDGGNRLPGKARLLEPGRTLWLDPAGTLLVGNDVEDEEEYTRFVEAEAKAMPSAPAGYPGMMPGDVMPGGMMPPDAMPMMPGMSPGLYPKQDSGKPKSGSKSKRKRPVE